MEVVLIIVSVLIIFLVLLFLIALRIKVVLNTEKSDAKMTLFWLGPVFKAFITMKDSSPVIRLAIFDKVIMKIKPKPRPKKSTSDKFKLVQQINPQDVHVNFRYGFNDPYNTGVACGAVNMASQFINIDSLIHTPDFTSSKDYIYLNATAKLNLGSTLVRLIKQRY